MDSCYFVGLDLAQPGESTALAVLERPLISPYDPPERRRPIYDLRHLHRFPLGTPFPDVNAAVHDLLRKLPRAVLAVDQTGVGGAIIDMLTDVLQGRVDCMCARFTITTGQAIVNETGNSIHVTKKDLVGTMQALFQTRRLRV
jgi:hypothetical protein